MASHTENQRELKDGALVVYQRTDVAKPIWHCRIKFPDSPYIRRSLKTRNEAFAIRKAEQLYDDLRYRFERGLVLRSPPMSKAIDEYLAWLEEEVERGDAKPKKLTDHRKLVRYAREYFGDQALDKITDGDVERYKEWRKTYWTRGPGSNQPYFEYERNGKTIRARRPKITIPAKSTLASEDVVLRAVFERANKLGWINRDHVPSVKTERLRTNRRPDFTSEEFERLMAAGKRRISQAKSGHVRYLRSALCDYVGLLAYSGMRPFEAIKLRIDDIDMFDTTRGKVATKIYVQGKNKERWLIANETASDYIYEILKRLIKLELLSEDVNTGLLSGYIFLMPDGRRIKSFKKGFRALLDAAGLRRDANGRERDAYSLRHYYATQRLLARVSVYTLAENMGTSVAMIEKHYGHLKLELAADELIVEI